MHGSRHSVNFVLGRSEYTYSNLEVDVGEIFLQSGIISVICGKGGGTITMGTEIESFVHFCSDQFRGFSGTKRGW